MIIIGHRGAKGLAPENTIKGIKRALVCKVDMIELDLRMQGDVIVLSHDETLNTESYTELEDALTTVQGKVPLNLEVKDPHVVPHLAKALKQYKGDILLSSFEFGTLQLIRTALPKTPIAVLEKWSGIRVVAEATLLGTKRIHINHQWLWSGFVRSMKHRGFELYAYTVNSRDRADELEAWGVDGIFTDYPSLFSE